MEEMSSHLTSAISPFMTCLRCQWKWKLGLKEEEIQDPVIKHGLL